MALFEPTIEVVGLVTLGCALVSLFVTTLLIILNILAPNGDQKMRDISKAIQQGALAFITVEYITLFVFVIVMVIVISTLVNWQTGVCYIVGAVISAISGAVGMLISTISNVRTTAAAEKSMYNALRIAFNSGSVMVSILTSLTHYNRDYQ
jgi:K(+)-stimulated pyrophosphate-energized sodium pump